MRWSLSDRFDPAAVAVADRHYNRQKIGTPQFVPPGRCLVLRASAEGEAVWASTWQYEQYAKHAWPGAWVNSTFRNEGAGLSSELIREAVAATCWRWGTPPAAGMVTFVDPAKVRRKRDPGRCYLRAGFVRVGFTKGGLIVLQLLPDAMPAPEPAINAQYELSAA